MSGILAAVGAAGIIALVSWAFYRIRRDKDAFDGEWYGAIYDEMDAIVKTDLFVLKVRGETVTGTMSRTYPHEQHERSWVFSGRIQNHSFFAIYWSENKRNVSSGCWFLAQIDDNRFEGNYYRNRHIRDDTDPTSLITSAKMVLTRTPVQIPGALQQ